MSYLLHCACGGQFAVKLKPNATEWQCPHCGAACTALGLLPESIPVATPVAPSVVNGPPTSFAAPPIVMSPVSVPPGNSHFDRPATASVVPLKRSQNPLVLIGIAGGGLLFLVIVLSLAQSLRLVRASARSAPKKKLPVAVKQISPRVATNGAARLTPSSNIPAITPRDTSPGVAAPAHQEMTKPEPVVASVEPPPAPPIPIPANTPIPKPVAVNALPGGLTALVQSHCVECHGATNQEGGLRLDDLAGRLLDEVSSDRWRKVLRRLQSEEMPPPKTSSLSKEDRNQWVTWLHAELQMLAERGPPRPTVRRLNRAEYVNSVQALTGLPLQATAVVEDVISTGFDTDASELNLSPQLIRQYVQLARAIAVELRRWNTPLPGSKLKLFGGADEMSEPSAIAEEARRRLQPFAQAAFRRPVEEAVSVR